MLSFILLPVVTIIASLCGTVTGFGISTVLMPSVLLFFSVHHALIFTGFIHWFVSFWRVLFFKKNIRFDVLFAFGIPAIIGSFIGASLTFYVDRTLFSRLFGAFLIMYTGFVFVQPKFAIKKRKTILGFGGIFAGFSAGLFGIRGAITSLFLTLFNLKKAMYLATISSIALCVDTARLSVYFYREPTWNIELIHIILISIPCSFLGAYLGRHIVKIIPEYYFRLVVVSFLCLIGIRLLIFY